MDVQYSLKCWFKHPLPYASPKSGVGDVVAHHAWAISCRSMGGDGINALVKPVLLKTKRISTGNHFVEEDFYPDDL
jgi:hypothetical protein